MTNAISYRENDIVTVRPAKHCPDGWAGDYRVLEIGSEDLGLAPADRNHAYPTVWIHVSRVTLRNT